MTQTPVDDRSAPARTVADSRRWMAEGMDLFLAALERASDADLAEPTDLPGWTGKHVVAHVAANADALRNLARWARTGEPTPMYASSEQRVADIEAGALREATVLREWARRAAAALEEDLDALTLEQWAAEVATAQGRRVPATEVPWLRAREVMVHAIDLRAAASADAVSFADLPPDFLAALVTDVVGKRASAPGPALTLEPTDSPLRWSLPGTGDPVTVQGPLADLTAYLSGRTPGAVQTAAGAPPPDLPPWL